MQNSHDMPLAPRGINASVTRALCKNPAVGMKLQTAHWPLSGIIALKLSYHKVQAIIAVLSERGLPCAFPPSLPPVLS